MWLFKTKTPQQQDTPNTEPLRKYTFQINYNDGKDETVIGSSFKLTDSWLRIRDTKDEYYILVAASCTIKSIKSTLGVDMPV